MKLGAIPMLAGAVALVVYLRTVAPALPTGDSGDLITAARVLGVAHPPGYPLYTMLGHLAGLPPLGPPALRLNLLSALLHAATVGLAGLLTYRLLGPDARRPAARDRSSPPSVAGRPACPGPAGGAALDPALAAAVGALLLGFSTAFWRYAAVAEVFPLNSLLAALLLLLLLEWRRRPDRAGLLWAFALGCGLAAANHHTVALLGPAFLVLLADGLRRPLPSGRVGEGASPTLPLSHSPARVGAVSAVLLPLGLLPYLYLPLAAAQDPPWSWGDPRTLDGFLRLVSRADYGTFRLAAEGQLGGSSLEQLSLLARYLYNAFTPPGCLLALAGAWWLARNRPLPGLALLLAFLLTGPAFVAYANPNISNPLWRGALERFYILPSLPFALAGGAGAFQVLLWVRRLSPPSALARPAAPLAGLALLALPAGSAVAHLAEVDQSANFVAHDFGQDVLAPLEPGALFFTRGDVVTSAVAYWQLVEGYRTDVVAIDMELLRLDWYVQQLRRQHPDLVIPSGVYETGRTGLLRALVDANIGRRPVYAVGEPLVADFGPDFDAVRAGFAARLLPRGAGVERFGILRQKLGLFERLHYPTTTYPDTTFESIVAHDYGRIAFDVANLVREAGRPSEAVGLYRTAIRLAPAYPFSYKNLGLLLLQQGAEQAETAALWETYLELNPDDPDGPAMRRQIELIRAR